MPAAIRLGGLVRLEGTRGGRRTKRRICSSTDSVCFDLETLKTFFPQLFKHSNKQSSLLQVHLSQLQLLQPCLCFIPGLISPEGLAIDHFHRTMYWTDSGLDKIERARLDGSERRALFHTDLVNPRAIAVDPIRGSAGLP